MPQLYAALDPMQSQIRLLRLEPDQTPSLENGRLLESVSASSDETRPVLRFTMDTVSLDDNPRFGALSYVWGDPTDTTTIVVNGIETPITKSLFAAVIATSKYETRPPFWADALCINQQDNAERSSQVRLMSRIYKQALRINCHLGELTPNIEAYVRYHEQVDGHATDDHWVQTIRHWNEQKVPSTEQATRIVAILSGEIELRTSEYFQRIWTLQEMYLSIDRAVFFVGDLVMTKFSLRKVCWMKPPECISGESREIVYNSGPASSTNMVLFEQFMEILIFNIQPINFINLSSLLCITRRRRCSEPRDKIFGVLSMLPTIETNLSDFATFFDPLLSALPHNGKQTIQPQFDVFHENLVNSLNQHQAARERYLQIDYKKPIKEVFRDALYYLATAENIDGSRLGQVCLWYKPYRCTSLIEDNARQPTRISYPSWLPDMASPSHRSTFATHGELSNPTLIRSNVEWLPRDIDKGYGDRLRFRITPLGRVVQTLVFPAAAETTMDLIGAILRESWPKANQGFLQQLDEVVASAVKDMPSEYRRPDPTEELQFRIREFVSLIKLPAPTHQLSTGKDEGLASLVPTGTHRLLNLLLLLHNGPLGVHISNHRVPYWLALSHCARFIKHAPPTERAHDYQVLREIKENIAGRALFVTDSGVCGLSSGDVEMGDIAALSIDFGHPMVVRPNPSTSNDPNIINDVCDEGLGALRPTHVLVDYPSIDGVVDDEYNDVQTIVLG